jgi:hypothetical protein
MRRRAVARSPRCRHALAVVAAAVLAAVAACSAPATSADDPPSAAPTAGPIALYTFEEPEHRRPVPIV